MLPRMSAKSPNSLKTDGSKPAPPAADFDAGMAEAVVEAALLGVGQNGVGFGRLLELFFGGLVAGIAIGMMTSSRASGRRS